MDDIKIYVYYEEADEELKKILTQLSERNFICIDYSNDLILENILNSDVILLYKTNEISKKHLTQRFPDSVDNVIVIPPLVYYKVKTKGNIDSINQLYGVIKQLVATGAKNRIVI